MKLGEMLVKAGLINEEMLNEAIEVQKKEGTRLGSTLVKLGYLTHKELLDFLSQQFNVPAYDLSEDSIDEEVLKLVPPELATRYLVVPVKKKGKVLTVAMANPGDLAAIEDLQFATGLEIKPVVASEDSLLEFIQEKYQTQKMLSDVMHEIEISEGMEGAVEVIQDKTEDEEEDMSRIFESAESSPVMKLASQIITDAVRMNASDLHIEPYEKSLRVRFRIDGILHEYKKLPHKIKNALVTVYKVMAKLKVEEKRLPQDGRIKARVGNRIVDLRVSTIPTIFGEKIAFRILDRTTVSLDLDTLGFDEESLRRFRKAIRTPFGIVLVTGPTGCGKTTTLYSALLELNDPGVNITTAEDPIEYSLHGINQVQMKEQVGLTFASALRSYLRQDPNIIMVGEIRDTETAEIAIRASLTGHLVLSSVHTNSAAATITRLVNMDVEPFLIASSLLAVESQRLVRKICPECKEEVEVPKEILIDAGIDPEKIDFPLYRGAGCKKCRGTGYFGRTGIFEVMLITKRIRELIVKKAPTYEIEKAGIEEGMIPLREAGLRKLREGITTVEEVIRETKVE
ncbi:type IV-A pilus assembly ATPase PilB [candidate division WOR-3 bacterium]|uniref:Type IV-A pilus assembly ATPase PilB n=1 Tax=candidate division WOR-3 bacterium TaxID=2052148 RepID=A0A660SM36_UNCW3|nr:MAG: type IV-A pilus assembly ATPase PilB [candidate division WOR-3 bacterium]